MSPRTVIWLAFMMAVFIYGVVGYVVPVEEGYGGAGSASIPAWFFPVMGLFMAVAALLVPTFLSGREVSAGGGALDGRELISWAMDESVAIVGLVTMFLGLNRELFPAYLAVSLVLLVVHRPRS